MDGLLELSQRTENQSHHVANLKNFICSLSLPLIIRLIKFKF
jgi:hypothetical protein